MQVDFKRLNQEHLEILKYTLKNNLFCGDSDEMQELCDQGLMEFTGKKSFVPDPYYRLTDDGKELMTEFLKYRN